MRKSAILATVAVVALAGCSKGSTDDASNNQADAAARSNRVSFPQGEYNKLSVTEDKWRELCENASGVTSGLLTNMNSTTREEESHLITNGGIVGVKTKWVQDTYVTYLKGPGCVVTLQLSGIYDSRSYNISVSRVVSSFIVNENKESLVHTVWMTDVSGAH